MSTSTHRIKVNETAYTNVSNGNLNATVINTSPCRVVIGGTEPAVDTLDFIHMSSKGLASVENLEAEDDIWVRAEHDEVEVLVIRGPAKVVVANG